VLAGGKLLVVPAVVLLIVAALAWGRALLVPLALATLFAFLLSPVVGAARRLGLGRVPAALVVVLLVASILGAAAWGLSLQLAALLDDVPRHTQAIKRRLAELRPGQGHSPLERARGALDEMVGELELMAPAPPPRREPLPVVVKEEQRGLIRSLPGYVPHAASAGLVLILVIFMLVERQDLRDRFIRLVGYGRLTVTTRALDEGTRRMSRYLLSQAIVNSLMGLGFGLGLLAVGVPYALLWGVALTLGRYVPFVGAWPAVALPAALAVAVFDGWWRPALVLGLYVVLAVVVNVVVEPVVYSQRIGVSRVALLVAVGFWAWLWGPIGLILATPLTVCLVVLGRHVPALDAVNLLIGDEPPIEPGAAYYQRLLARDHDEAAEIVERRIAEGSIEAAWDGVVIPALAQARADRVAGRLAEADERAIVAATGDLVDDVGGRAGAPGGPPAPAAPPPALVLGCPARDEAEVVALAMFRQLVSPALCAVEIVPAGLLSSELVARVAERRPALLCVASLPPGGVAHTRYLLKRLGACCPGVKILVGRWGARDGEEQRRALLEAGADGVATTLVESRDQLLALAPVLSSAPETPGGGPVAVGLQPASAGP